MPRIHNRNTKFDAAVLIFGLVHDEPHGAWLTDKDAERLVPTSLASPCSVVSLDDDQKAHAAKLPRGQVLRKGRVHLPAIARELYAELERTFPSQHQAPADADGDTSLVKTIDAVPAEPIATPEPAVAHQDDSGGLSPTTEPVR